jgi:U3 small nucleolar RNA-associated protein 21
MDCLIKVWDVPSGKLIDCFRFHNAPTSICLSATGEFLATAHVDELCIYLWSNKTLYSHVPLSKLPDDYEPTDEVEMPNTRLVSRQQENETNQMNIIDDEDDDYKNYISPEQINFNLITLSALPESRWKNLINLDVIKQRNKPKEPPKVPKMAPFFLPTISNESGFTFKTALEEAKRPKSLEKTPFDGYVFLSDFTIMLSKATAAIDCIIIILIYFCYL